MSTTTKVCKRCERPNEWLDYCARDREKGLRDAPFAFNGYCSAMCQALDLREELIDAGHYDPVTGVFSVSRGSRTINWS